ncbi:hypothetical protein [Vibrio rotiferianus]|uniref:hypothetical protein n=1 Tax=Vibrio rotiferianus TaxID=190895 RepID=UPI00406A43E3
MKFDLEFLIKNGRSLNDKKKDKRSSELTIDIKSGKLVGTLEALCKKWNVCYSSKLHRKLERLGIIYITHWSSKQPHYDVSEEYTYLGFRMNKRAYDVIAFYDESFEQVIKILDLLPNKSLSNFNGSIHKK